MEGIFERLHFNIDSTHGYNISHEAPWVRWLGLK